MAPRRTKSEEPRSSGSLYGTKKELDLARRYIKALAGAATPDDLDKVRRALPGGLGNSVSSGDTESPLGQDGSSGPSEPVYDEAPRGPGELSLDGQPPDVDPLTHKRLTDLIPEGAKNPPTGDVPDDDEPDKPKVKFETFVPLLQRIPNIEPNRDRETVLRFLTVRGPAERRLEVSSFVETLAFDEAVRLAGLTETDRALLLTMPQRLAQSAYTNVVCSGDGLHRFAP